MTHFEFSKVIFRKANSVIDDQKEIVGTKTMKVNRKQNTKKTRKRGDSPVSNQFLSRFLDVSKRCFKQDRSCED